MIRKALKTLKPWFVFQYGRTGEKCILAPLPDSDGYFTIALLMQGRASDAYTIAAAPQMEAVLAQIVLFLEENIRAQNSEVVEFSLCDLRSLVSNCKRVLSLAKGRRLYNRFIDPEISAASYANASKAFLRTKNSWNSVQERRVFMQNRKPSNTILRMRAIAGARRE